MYAHPICLKINRLEKIPIRLSLNIYLDVSCDNKTQSMKGKTSIKNEKYIKQCGSVIIYTLD